MSRRAWLLMVRNQFLGFVREPAAAGFNLAVPFFIVIVQAIAYGDMKVNDLPGYRVVDVLPVSAATMFVMIIGIFGMGIGLASMIEARSLSSYRLRPGGVTAVVAAYGSVLVLLIVCGLVASTAVLAVGWQINAPARWILLLPVTLLTSAAFIGLGSVSASLGGSPRSAQAVSSGLFFPLLFLSGAMFPTDQFPVGLRLLGEALPGYHAYQLYLYSWVSSQSFPLWSFLYIFALLIGASILGVRLMARREQL